MISSFSRFSTFALLLMAGLFLNACAQNGQTVSGHNGEWYNPSNWFGNNSQNGHITQSPDISHIKGPLTPPAAAPPDAVQREQLPPQIISQAPSPNVAPPVIQPVLSGDIAPSAVQPPVIEPALPPSKIKVALLLPLTGHNAALGKAMLNAAQQAVFDAGDDRFELMPHDTGENEATAETAARDAMKDGAQLIIGPIFATKVPAVRAIAEAGGVNVLTLSTDATLAGNGVYVLGFAPPAQVERVVHYAAMRGLRHFAALVPDNPYGNLAGSSFKQSVATNGGTVVAYEVFDPAKHDSASHIAALAQQRDKIDALLLPAGGSDLSLIAGQLQAAGFDNNHVRLLGTGLWDTDTLAKDAPFLISGWYAASDPAGRAAFIKAYEAAYNQEPPRLATLAYDATALAAVLEKRGSRFDAQDLTNPNGFAGIDGIFRLTPQGMAERGLAVLEVTPELPRVIDPAPTTFEK